MHPVKGIIIMPTVIKIPFNNDLEVKKRNTDLCHLAHLSRPLATWPVISGLEIEVSIFLII